MARVERVKEKKSTSYFTNNSFPLRCIKGIACRIWTVAQKGGTRGNLKSSLFRDSISYGQLVKGGAPAVLW